PAHATAVLGHFHGGEHVRAQRLIWLLDHEGHVEQRHETLPNIDPLFLAAHEHRNLLAARDQLLGSLDPRRLRRIDGRRRLGALTNTRPALARPRRGAFSAPGRGLALLLDSRRTPGIAPPRRALDDSDWSRQAAG